MLRTRERRTVGTQIPLAVPGGETARRSEALPLLTVDEPLWRKSEKGWICGDDTLEVLPPPPHKSGMRYPVYGISLNGENLVEFNGVTSEDAQYIETWLTRTSKECLQELFKDGKRYSPGHIAMFGLMALHADEQIIPSVREKELRFTIGGNAELTPHQTTAMGRVICLTCASATSPIDIRKPTHAVTAISGLTLRELFIPDTLSINTALIGRRLDRAFEFIEGGITDGRIVIPLTPPATDAEWRQWPDVNFARSIQRENWNVFVNALVGRKLVDILTSDGKLDKDKLKQASAETEIDKEKDTQEFRKKYGQCFNERAYTCQRVSINLQGDMMFEVVLPKATLYFIDTPNIGALYIFENRERAMECMNSEHWRADEMRKKTALARITHDEAKQWEIETRSIIERYC